MVGRLLTSVVVALFVQTVAAHPIPRDTHDRTITISLNPAAVLIEYHLEVDEVVAAADLRRDGDDGPASSEDRHRVYLAHYTPIVLAGLRVDLDGRERELECIEFRHIVSRSLDTPARCFAGRSGLVWIWSRITIVGGPSNGTRPMSSSYSTTPAECWSAAPGWRQPRPAPRLRLLLLGCSLRLAEVWNSRLGCDRLGGINQESIVCLACRFSCQGSPHFLDRVVSLRWITRFLGTVASIDE